MNDTLPIKSPPVIDDSTARENELTMALLNIMEDFNEEKRLLERSQKALLNILEDFEYDKLLLEQSQRAMLNLLEDSVEEKDHMGYTKMALMNILSDYNDKNEELTNSGKLLEEKVEERTHELKKSNEELESFSYSVSHDLRAPLRAINGYASVLKEDFFDKLNDEGKRTIETIVRNATKMAGLIDDILMFSQLGRQQLQLEEIDMNRAFESAISDSLKEKGDRDVEIRIDKLATASGDRSMVNQLIFNLVSNAFKYSRHQEKTIIEIKGIESDKGYVYSVKDNGVGFNMAYKSKLFGVFQRLHKEREFEGTGVGLAIAQRVVSHHKGEIWANSDIGKGATFYFTLGT